MQAFVVVGDHDGHVGLGVKCAKEVRHECLPSPVRALAAYHCQLWRILSVYSAIPAFLLSCRLSVAP